MSHRNKGTGRRGLDPYSFSRRSMHMQPEHDTIALMLFTARQAFETSDATEQQWAEVAAFINMGGTFARERKRQDWLADLNAGADAMRAALARNERVGGRWAMKPEEAAALHVAITCLDQYILPAMTVPDFIRIGTAINNLT